MIPFTIPTNTLESEITTLESELQIKRDALKAAKKLEKQATSTIENLAAVVEALKSMPEQLEALRVNVLSLFPEVEPAPDKEAISDEPLPTPPIMEAVEALQRGDFIVEAPKVETAPEVEPEPTPAEDEVKPEQPKIYTGLKQVSRSVSYLVNYKGEILASYVASSNAGQLRKLAKNFIEPLAKGWNLRTEGDKDKRTLGYKYEIRILDLSLAQIKKLAFEIDGWQEEPQTAIEPTVALPEFALIRDTSEDSLLGEIWLVYGVENDRRKFGSVREHLMNPGTWMHSRQRDTNGADSIDDAAKALIAEWVHDERLNTEMNQAIANRYMEPESLEATAPF